MIKIPIAIVASVIVFASARQASVLPPVTRSSAVGIWEGMASKDLRAFRFQVGEEGRPSFLATSAGMLNPYTLVFEITRITVKDGKLHAEGTGPDKSSIRIDGNGNAVRRTSGASYDEGLINGTVTVLNSESKVENTWNVAFVNYEGHYFEKLQQLGDATRRGIDLARGSTGSKR